MRFIRTVLGAVIAAALGAVLGRLVAGLRREAQGDEAMAFDAASLTPSPQELVPGLVAALRVQDAPWSALHVPPWLAAFAVNFALAAVGRELGPVLRTFGFGRDDEDEAADRTPSGRGDLWTVEATPTRSESAPETREHPASSDSPYRGFRPFTT